MMISRGQAEEKRSGLGMQIKLCSIAQFSQEDGSLDERMGEASKKGRQAHPWSLQKESLEVTPESLENRRAGKRHRILSWRLLSALNTLR